MSSLVVPILTGFIELLGDGLKLRLLENRGLAHCARLAVDLCEVLDVDRVLNSGREVLASHDEAVVLDEGGHRTGLIHGHDDVGREPGSVDDRCLAVLAGTPDEMLLIALAKDRDERHEDVLYLREDLQMLYDDYR